MLDSSTLNILRSQHPEFTWQAIKGAGVIGARGTKDEETIEVFFWADTHQWVAQHNGGSLTLGNHYTACQAVDETLATD